VQTSGTKFRPSAEYLQSPLTGSQMDLTISPDFRRDREDLHVRIRIPLASALLGQNWMHGWTETLDAELQAASRLVRVVLMSYQFRAEEIDRFFATTRTVSAELTWHIQTASYRAAKNLLMRVYQMIKVLHAHNSSHDVGVAGYVFYDENQRESLKVYLKNGSAMKFYVKVDEMADTRRRKARGVPMHEAHRADTATVREEIGTHLRVEVIPCEKQLREHGASNPGAWNPELLETIAEEILDLAGFKTPYLPEAGSVDVNGLSASLRRSLTKYRTDGVVAGLTDSTFSRHRQALLCRGIDIGIPPPDHRCLNANIGRQLHFSKRWIAPQTMRNFMMSDATLPVLSTVLEEMAARIGEELTPERLAQLENQRRLDAIPGKVQPSQREADVSGFDSQDELR
jgi:hypothetical protein